MLYQTHHPFLFQFQSFAPIPLSATSRSFSPLTFLSSSLQEMECVEGALKSSIRKEMALKSSPQAVFDDLLALNPQNGVSCEDFFVDDLLDLSNEDGFVQEEEEEQKASPCPSVERQDHQDQKTNLSSSEDFGSAAASELAVPADDLADLEWLSHFVEDSFSEYSVPFPTGTLLEKPKWQTGNRPQPVTPVSEKPCFKTPVPAKARSKRARTGGRVWSLGSPSFTESSSSSTSSSTSSSLSNSSPWLIGTNIGSGSTLEPVSCERQLAKKQKKNPSTEAGEGGGIQLPRRCSHCGVQKTPQWRTGPLGAKTLCNACGVRYKSGRLLPEYRPACSPTFSSELHSNHHRKVLEMRRKKETLGQADSSLSPLPVPSF